MTNTRPEIEFAHVWPPEKEKKVKPVQAFGYEIPEQFKVGFFFRSSNEKRIVCWSVGMHIEITTEGFPRTQRIEFDGDRWMATRKDRSGRYLYFPVQEIAERRKLGLLPVNFEKIRSLTSSPRNVNYLQSLSVAVAIDSLERIGNVWQVKNNFAEIHSDELKLLAKKFLEKKTRGPRDHIDYEEVARLYKEAKFEGYRVRQHIAAYYNNSDDLTDVPIDTVNNWIKTCRMLELLPKSNYQKKKNSSPTKVVQDARKPKTTKKIGEK